ncbi:MAG: hypothetical protein C0398_00955 [Coprothermobacter sp.]|nr:hypothetical protein [Coprothermobacter sp.]
MIIISLIDNLALLVALSVVSGFIGQRRYLDQYESLLQGFLFGSAAVIGMLVPLTLAPGLIFDGRSVVISLCGLFFGPVALVVAGGMAVTLRIVQGGSGAVMGVLVILSSGLLGILFRTRYIHQDGEVSTRQLLGFGLLVHLVMLALTSTLPAGMILDTLKRIGLPVILTYPLATVLIGKILSDRVARGRFLEALEESRQRFQGLVETLYDWVWEVDPKGHYTYVSPRVKGILGYEPEDIVGKTPFELMPAEEAQRVTGIFGPLTLQQKPVIALENICIHKDGHPVVLETSGLPFYDAHGNFKGYRGTDCDITERKLAEEALHRLNRELRAISKCNQTMLRAVDEQTLLNDICRIICDEAGYRLAWVGYAEHDDAKTVRPVAWAGLDSGYIANANITWADTERGRGPTGKAIRSGRISYVQDFTTDPQMAPWRESALQHGYRSSIALPLKDKGAHTFGVVNIYSTEPNAITADEIRLLEELSGDLAFGIMVLRDRTERKRVANIMQTRLRLLEFASSHSMDELLTATLDEIEALTGSTIGFYHFVESDQKTLSLQNWSTNTLKNMCTAEGKGSHYDIAQAGVWADCVNERRPVIHNDYASLPHRKGMPDGHAPIIREVVVPIFRGNQIKAIIGVGNKSANYDESDIEIVSQLGDLSWDITECKRGEEEKAKLEEQYRQAQKMESVGRLAGGVAHDLNNLLTPILGFGGLLLDDFSPDDPHRESVQQIVKAAEKSRDLVRQLMAFGRKQVLEFRPLDLNAVVTEFEKLLRHTLHEDIALKVILALSIPAVLGDIGQLEQVVMNLAVNAQDAMPEGGRLTIETSVADLDAAYVAAHQGVVPGRYVLLVISDTGIGMDAETQERIFEPFFTTKEKGKGTGLGLATVYGIVKQHDGNIWVYSELGKGTTFKIYLPAVETAAEPVERAQVTPLEDLRGTETILLAEDAAVVRSLAQGILEQQGYRVLLAENGRAALSILAGYDGPVQLLLSDVVMPEMNGRELFASISKDHPGMKVLYMSGYTENVIAHRGVLEAGVQFIQKPFTIHALAAKVRYTLDDGEHEPQ